MLDAGDRACAIEVSSHALALHRVDAHPLRRGAVHQPDPGPPRLPRHDGGVLRRQAQPVRGRPGARVVNVDDPYGAPPRRRASRRASTFALDAAAPTTARASCASASPAPASRAHPRGRARAAQTRLPGALQRRQRARRARRRARARRPARARSRRRCRRSRRRPGASRRSTRASRSRVLVDYAHTPDSLENVLRAARSLAEAPRDRACSAAAATATAASGRRWGGSARSSPTSRSSPPTTRARRSRQAIVEEILAGDRARRARVEAIVDRRDAIARAIALAQPGDVVVIAGKGHEQGQEFEGGRKVPFDDAAGRRIAALAGARMRDWTAQRVAAAAGAALAAPTPAGGRAGRGIDRLARARARRSLRGPARRTASDGGRFAAAALEAGAWGVLARPEHLAGLEEHGSARARGARPARRARRPRARAPPRAGCDRGRGHRLDRQDLDQGHPRGALGASRADRRERGQPQHRDRRAAGDPAGAGRHAVARPRARDARQRADRGAHGDLRARRRRDRQRRPGAPRTARLARGDRRRQGRAARGHARRRRGRASGGRAAARAPSALRPAHRALRRGRRGRTYCAPVPGVSSSPCTSAT